MARFAVGLSLCVLLAVPLGLAQVNPNYGILPFSTNRFGVDLATGFVNISIPMRSKAGKIPFSSGIAGTSSAWPQKITSGPLNGKYQWYPSLVGTGQTQGFFYNDPAQLQLTTISVDTGGGCYNNSDAIVYDRTGASHNFNVGWYSGGGSSCYTSASGVATDGSGYTIVVTNGQPTVYDKSGNYWVGICISTCHLKSTVTDTDGATITDGSSGGNNLTATDSLGQLVLTGTLVSGGSNWGSFSYTDTNGTTQYYTLGYTTLPIATNFACSNPYYLGTIYEYTSTGRPLLTSITTPAGGEYSISYEPTPGEGGSYTGRVAEITLPTGGSISYAYSGGNNGINCNSFVVPTLTVTVKDNNGNTSPWTYVNSNNSSNFPGNFTVSETDPAGNQTVYSFAGEYQTQAVFNQGTSTTLKTVLTCYNGNTSNCASPGSVPTLPITETDVRSSLNTSSANRVTTTLDSYGNTLVVSAYDFGGTLNSPTGTLLSVTTNVYGRSYKNATACNAYAPGTYIYNTPCYSHTGPTAGSDLAETKVSYNPDGKPALTSRWTGATENTWLTTSFGYGANGAAAGVLSSVTEPNTALTSFTSFDCNGMLPAGTTYPLTSVGSDSQIWNCNGGVVTSRKDVNGNTTILTYNDPLWRLTEVANPDGGATTTIYNTGTSFPWTIATCSTMNASSSCPSGTNSLTGLTKLDGLGRTIETQRTSDPNGTSYVDTTYDVLGRVASTSNPYYTSGDPTYGLSQYAYDALGRVTTITNPDNSQRLTGYSGAWANVQDEGNGTNRVIKLYQRDGLGRLIQICEVSNATQLGSGGTPVSCGAYGANGFLTTNSYDALGNLTYVTQGAQNRTYQYDGLSRLTVDANPEAWGPTTYAYDVTGQQGDLYQRSMPKQNLQSGNGNWTATYTFDALHRMTGVSYNDGTTPSVQWIYDSASPWGKSATNPKRRLVATRVNNASTGALIAGEGFITHDPMGRVQWRLQNGQGSEYDLNYTYDYLGDVVTASNGAGVTFTTSYNTATEVSGVTSSLSDANHPGTLWEGPQYNALGQVTTDNLGFLNEHYAYTNRGWLYSYWACTVPGNSCSSSQMAYTFNMQTGNNQQPLGFAPNGDILVANDWINGNWTYSYDDFNRLSSSYCGTNCPGAQSALGFNYLFDRFGNRWQQNGTAGSGPHPQYGFDGNGHITSMYYDAAGNMVNDLMHSYTYDAENRVTAVDSGNTASYVYNASGQRVSKTSSAGTVYYLYDIFGHQVAEFSSSGAWNRGEVYVGSKHLATYVGGSGGSTYLDLADWVGTERMRVKSNQSPQETCTGLPFGDMQSCTGTDENPMHFTGKQRDTETNDDYFGARYYSSTQGRFTRPDEAFADQDPDDPQTWNLYTYGLNNPLRYTDPTGMSHMDAHGFWVGDSNGECEQQNGGTVCWNAKANEWQAPPPPQKMDNGAVSPGMLGPGDLILFSGVRTPSFVSELIGKALGSVFGKGAESGIQKLGLEGAAEAANAAETQGLVTQAASTVGNQGVKASSKAIAEQAAKDWVGPGARPITDNFGGTGRVVGEISADGTRVARFTSVNKAQPYVNLVNRVTGGNLHVSW
jgi:RHS repeat-associated protein